jgi:hypothetical protein
MVSLKSATLLAFARLPQTLDITYCNEPDEWATRA